MLAQTFVDAGLFDKAETVLVRPIADSEASCEVLLVAAAGPWRGGTRTKETAETSSQRQAGSSR